MLTLRNPNDEGHFLPFHIIGYSQGNRAIDRPNNYIHIFPHDQLLGHGQTHTYLPLVITSGKFDLRPQNTFLVDFTQGQFEAIEGIIAKNCRWSRVGINHPNFNGALGI